MVHYYQTRTFPADQPISSDLAPIILTPDTALVSAAERYGVATPEQHDFFRQHRQHRIELAMEKYNSLYLGNRRRRPVKTRISGAYYIYSQPSTPDYTPGTWKSAQLD
jgi:hypothetical protein